LDLQVKLFLATMEVDAETESSLLPFSSYYFPLFLYCSNYSIRFQGFRALDFILGVEFKDKEMKVSFG